MFFIMRLLAVVLLALFILIFGLPYCALRPKNPNHVSTFGHLIGRFYKVFGIKLQLSESSLSQQVTQAVYIGNHQSNWDLITISNAVRPGTVTVGKKSLAFIPVFGQLYWLSGNILIDRKNRSRAVNTILQVVEKMKSSGISIWMFPEGTRSRGRGLLPFKTGAFHTAIDAGVPIVPIVCSSTDACSVFRGNNGHVLVEMLDPISTEGLTKADVRQLAKECHELMEKKLVELNSKVEQLNAAALQSTSQNKAV
ncbi:MAG: 1-acylglycerol-3-phosphate O-acyltransferase [Vibrionaceae bacterium]